MFRCFLLLIIFLFYSKVNAQQVLNGFLKDSLTHLPISTAKIFNRTTTQTVWSNTKGLFSIKANTNDIILISPDGYSSRTITYSSLFADTILLYLSSSSKLLLTVSVSSRYNQYQMDSMNRKKDFEQMRGGRLNNISAAPGFGVAINLDRILKKRYKYQRRNEKLFAQREKDAYIAYRYSPQLVAYYTGLKDEELEEFMKSHTPSYEWLRRHTSDDEVFYYINEHLKLFRNSAKKSF